MRRATWPSGSLCQRIFDILGISTKRWASTAHLASAGAAVHAVAWLPRLGARRSQHLAVGTHVEAAELQPATHYDSPLDPKFREPKTYRVTPYASGGMNAAQFEMVHLISGSMAGVIGPLELEMSDEILAASAVDEVHSDGSLLEDETSLVAFDLLV